jgi:hypothetical protein
MYMKIECENLEQIQHEADNWIRNNAVLSDHGLNEIDYKLFLVLNPTLSKFLIEKKFFIRKVFVNVGDTITTEDPLMVIPLDDDSEPEMIIGSAKIKGTQQLVCSFFKIPETYSLVTE